MKKIFIVAFILPLLGGCASSPQGIYTIYTAKIPRSLLHCLPAPLRHKKKIRITRREAAKFLLRYKTAHRDCKNKLRSIRSLSSKW